MITSNVQKIIHIAATSARLVGKDTMPVHLLHAITQVPDCLAARFLVSSGVTREGIELVASVPLSDMTPQQIIDKALVESKSLGSETVVSEAILLVLARDCNQTRTILDKIKEGTADSIVKLIQGDNATKPLQSQSKLPPEILKMGADLTLKARSGKIDPIIGRDEETQRLVEILSRKTKNNPVLIGEAGVGKSAIVEGLALRINNNDVPKQLEGKTLFALDIASLMSGTKFRGELEARLERLLKFLENDGTVILFIDELHTVMKVNEEIAELMKPKLARGEIQCIGATTTEEYRKHIEKDAALERRFAPIIVNPPSPEETILILKGIRPSFEKFHELEISNEAIEQAVSLSDRYINDRNLPDKAIDILDEACAKNKMTGVKVITKDHIAIIVSRQTGIPVTKMTATDKANMSALEVELKKTIIGQDKAISAIAKAVRRGRAGVADENRPTASFMFLGRTGIGKTEVCKALAKQLFSNDKALIKLDMSEFSEAHSVSKLIGSPPGYVGYDDASALCERVRRNPYSLVLFDEIEKAHPEIYNVLLQILDEGRLTDNKGKTTSFKNCLIVMTSNVGVDNLSKTKRIGFSSADESLEEEEAIRAGLKKRFKPEFLNRIDNIIVFSSLDKQGIKAITLILVDKLIKKLSNQKITLSVSDQVIEHLVEKGYDREFGARPLRRVIQTELEDRIAEEILKSDSIKSVSANLENGEVVCRFFE